MPSELHIPTEIDLVAFISKEAHDLKSPFNRALGFLKLVLKGMDGPISDQAKEDLTIAYQNTQYTLTMMSSLVDFARLGRGERSPSLTPHAAPGLVQQAIAEWKRQSHREGQVKINSTVPDVQVLSDEMMMRQALGKWIFYVAEFVQEEVVVDIHVETLDESCLFTIRSTGKKTQPPPECDLTMHGFIAQTLVALHKGEMVLLEEDDQGAVVQFKLPAVHQ
jgi:signal transduction histidine kinase